MAIEPLFYRDYKITETDYGWAFIHNEYDGAPEELGGPPGDNRHGWCKELVEALREIDEIEDE